MCSPNLSSVERSTASRKIMVIAETSEVRTCERVARKRSSLENRAHSQRPAEIALFT